MAKPRKFSGSTLHLNSICISWPLRTVWPRRDRRKQEDNSSVTANHLEEAIGLLDE